MTNGGVTLFLNGKQIAEATNIKNHTNLYSFNYEAGKSYDIELRFIQVKDNPALNFDLAKQTPMDAREILNKLQSADVVIFAGGISPYWKENPCGYPTPDSKAATVQKSNCPPSSAKFLLF